VFLVCFSIISWFIGPVLGKKQRASTSQTAQTPADGHTPVDPPQLLGQFSKPSTMDYDPSIVIVSQTLWPEGDAGYYKNRTLGAAENKTQYPCSIQGSQFTGSARAPARPSGDSVTRSSRDESPMVVVHVTDG